MSFKQRQQGRAPALRDSSPLIVPSSSVGVDYQLLTPQKATLKLTNETLSIDESDDFGSLQLCTWQDRNIHLLAVEADLTLVKGGVTNGLEATTDVNVALGSAAATAVDLTATAAENDKVESTALTDNSLTVELDVHSQSQSGDGAMPQQLPDGASNGLFLNASVTAGITASDALTVSGNVDLYFVDLGNRTS